MEHLGEAAVTAHTLAEGFGDILIRGGHAELLEFLPAVLKGQRSPHAISQHPLNPPSRGPSSSVGKSLMGDPIGQDIDINELIACIQRETELVHIPVAEDEEHAVRVVRLEFE